MKKVVFRADSGSHMGMGHVMRCLSLAQKLAESNFEVHFISKDHHGLVREKIEENFGFHLLANGVKAPLSSEDKDNYQKWLGGSVEDDLLQTNGVIAKLGNVDLAIVDHYSLDKRFEESLNVPHVVAIDDLYQRPHTCEILLNQNVSADRNRYVSLVPSETELLMGPSFALLRDEFSQRRRRPVQRDVKKIMVFFGGGDVGGETLKFAKMALPLFGSRYQFTFVLDQHHRDFSELKSLTLDPHRVFGLVSHMVELMLETHLFIGAGGTSALERACLGVPSAMVCVSENQRDSCEAFRRQKLAYYLGDSSALTQASWRSFFDEIVPNEALWYDFALRGYEMVDGQGAARVRDLILRKCG